MSQHDASTACKRPLEASEEALDPTLPSKRRQRIVESASTAAPKAIAVALEGNNTLPPAIRKLLLDVTEGCLCVPKNRRDPFQEKVGGLLREALDTVDASLEHKVACLNDEVEDKNSDIAIRDAAEVAAEARHASARVAVLEKRMLLAKETVALRKATDKVTAALSAQEAGDAISNDAKAQQGRLQEAEDKLLMPLKAGEFVGSKAKKQALSLSALGKRNEFDESLTSGLVDVLVKKPEARSSFDAMVIQAFETQLQTRIAELDKTVAEEAPGQESRAEAVSMANSDQDAAKMSQDARNTDLKKELLQVKDAAVAVSTAKKALSALNAHLLRLEKERTDATAALMNFRETSSATLDALRAAADTEALDSAFQQFEDKTAAAAALTASAPVLAENADAKNAEVPAEQADGDTAAVEPAEEAVVEPPAQPGQADGDDVNATEAGEGEQADKEAGGDDE